ncbi:5234_t:CDS:2 [Ambispora gerdemannii]|uniref:DASH complex subunit DAD2 n=1 Tax=Ambispora gerdemannii TaxID=144530 RepID=A0A9N8ZFZ7_9GLOM|nr:5234_t:CDS:2 [Ambispora gerdemannii]
MASANFNYQDNNNPFLVPHSTAQLPPLQPPQQQLSFFNANNSNNDNVPPQQQQLSFFNANNNSIQQLNVPPYLLNKLNEKQLEFDHLLIVKETSAQMLIYFNVLAEKLDELNVGCQAVANVLRNWQEVFRAVSITETTKTKEKQQQKSEHDYFASSVRDTPPPPHSYLSSSQTSILSEHHHRQQQQSMSAAPIPVLVRVPTEK